MMKNIFLALVAIFAWSAVSHGANFDSYAMDLMADADPGLDFGDVIYLRKRSDGRFDVLCRDGRKQVLTEEELTKTQVCGPPTPVTPVTPTPVEVTDPFDPAYCVGEPMSSAHAFSQIPLPKAHIKVIGKLNLAVRSKLCLAADGCLGWDENGGWHPKVTDYNHLYFKYGSGYSHYGNGDGYIDVELRNDHPILRIASNYLYNYRRWQMMWDKFGSWISGEKFPETEEPYADVFAVQDQEKVKFKPVLFSGLIANHCLAMRGNNIFPVTLTGGNTGHIIQEFVWYSKFDK